MDISSDSFGSIEYQEKPDSTAEICPACHTSFALVTHCTCIVISSASSQTRQSGVRTFWELCAKLSIFHSGKRIAVIAAHDHLQATDSERLT
jgi:hypothetical protein